MSPIMFCRVETNPLVGIYIFSLWTFLKESIKKKYNYKFFSGQLKETDVQLRVPTFSSPFLRAYLKL